jgi:hypothetical protein
LKNYIDAEHKAKEREIIKADTSRRIVDREYNTANYLAQHKQKLESELVQVEREMFMAREFEEELDKQNSMAVDVLDVKLRELESTETKKQQLEESVISNAEKIERQERRLSTLKNAFIELIVNATEYAENISKQTLSNIRGNFKVLRKGQPELAKTAHMQALEIQPTDEQKEDIDNAYSDSIKPR